MSSGQAVCRSRELGVGEMRECRIEGGPIVVIRAADGSLHALAGRCLHQGAPLAEGRLYQRAMPADRVGRYRFERGREVLKCPWHGYEYDIRTGATVFDAGRCLQRLLAWEDGEQVVVARRDEGGEA
jgi:nitrite reductase/ring-hydroxylating ferredoxin subunit